MVKVMKYQLIPKCQTVFNYESIGDIFYIVISGKVLCKIPEKKVVYLADAEKSLFLKEFKDDIISISHNKELNE